MTNQAPGSPPSRGLGTPASPCLTCPSLKDNRHALEEERTRFEREVATLKAEQQNFLERYIRLEEQNALLTSLYVACQRLHGQLSRSEVLLAVRELITNLIGCEEYVLFRLGPDGWLYRVDSFGLNPDAFEKRAPGSGLIGRALKTGQTYLRHDDAGDKHTDEESNLTACIPLQRDGVVTGAITLFRLLPQKPEYLGLDFELFGLLKTHLATVLYCLELHESARTRSGAVA